MWTCADSAVLMLFHELRPAQWRGIRERGGSAYTLLFSFVLSLSLSVAHTLAQKIHIAKKLMVHVGDRERAAETNPVRENQRHCHVTFRNEIERK